MHFCEKVINLEVLGYYLLVGSIVSMRFNKPGALDVYLAKGGTFNTVGWHQKKS